MLFVWRFLFNLFCSVLFCFVFAFLSARLVWVDEWELSVIVVCLLVFFAVFCFDLICSVLLCFVLFFLFFFFFLVLLCFVFW